MQGQVVRQGISRPCNFKQAGECYRSFEDWGRDELISNLVGALSQCDRDIQERMVPISRMLMKITVGVWQKVWEWILKNKNPLKQINSI